MNLNDKIVRKIRFPMTLRRRTVAGDLGFGLSVLVTVSFLLLGIVNFIYSYRSDLRSLDSKAKELAQNATEVLASPVWNIDEKEIERIIGVFLQYDIVTGIRLVNENGDLIHERWKTRESPRLILSRPITHNGETTGELTLWITDTAIRDKQLSTLIFLGVALALAIAAVNFGSRRLMKRYLSSPISRLIEGLDVIARGNYKFQLPLADQEEVNRINSSVNSMAMEISARETTIDENRQRLEILNTAIMEIFSGHNSATLIDQTMRSVARLTRPEIIAFIPTQSESVTKSMDELDNITQTGESDSSEKRSDRPHPRLLQANHFIELPAGKLEEEIATIFHQEGASQGGTTSIYHFPLKSRHRHVGDFSIKYNKTPDPQVHALLKSIMSLSTVAMIRQAFIRESAFMTAELKVAESVQKAIVPTDQSRSSYADVSMHYQPILRVGGDWLNFIEDPRRKIIYLMTGDVTGHGIAQSMITTAVSGAVESLRNLMATTESFIIDQPSQIIELVAKVVKKINGESNLLMTCVVVKIDFESRILTVCNAGHQYPVLLTPGDSGYLIPKAVTGGLTQVLGMTDEQMTKRSDKRERNRSELENFQMQFPRNSKILIFTDGLVDSRAANGKTFHRNFFKTLQNLKSGTTSSVLLSEILATFNVHAKGGVVPDDVCVVVAGD